MRPRASARWASGIAVLLAGCLVLAGCSGGGSQGGQGWVGGEGLVTTIDPDDRPEAPEVAGTSLTGEQVALADFSGDIVVLNIWGSWCPPCRAEAPVLAEVSAELRDRGVSFLGVAIRDNTASARAFEQRYGIEYPSIDDPGGRQLLGFAGSYPAAAVPVTYVITPDGLIAARVLDEVDRSTLTGLIEDVAAEYDIDLEGS